MSITVEYINHIGEKSNEVIPYEYGDYHLHAHHLTCSTMAKRHGQYFKSCLDKDRNKESNQGELDV